MGPLHGIRIIEMAGVGPAPMCAMLLADLGASVIRIERIGSVDLGIARPRKFDLLLRNRHVIALDLKSDEGMETMRQLAARSDALIEGFRPGVMERLGLGPEALLDLNARLVYGRMTGWGQEGPLSQTAGHDINYIAVTGALDAIGTAEQPVIPINFLGDFGGGALYLALGILAAVLEARTSGQGQVVDAAIVDGTASLMTSFHGLAAAGIWRRDRASNIADGGAPHYNVYRCADGNWISVGALEGRFFEQLIDGLGIDRTWLGYENDSARWPALHALISERFGSRPRTYWCDRFAGRDACVAPVLSPDEAHDHPHLKARATFLTIDGVTQPAPAPRFSRTPSDVPRPPQSPSRESMLLAFKEWFGAETVAQKLVDALQP